MSYNFYKKITSIIIIFSIIFSSFTNKISYSQEISYEEELNNLKIKGIKIIDNYFDKPECFYHLDKCVNNYISKLSSTDYKNSIKNLSADQRNKEAKSLFYNNVLEFNNQLNQLIKNFSFKLELNELNDIYYAFESDAIKKSAAGALGTAALAGIYGALFVETTTIITTTAPWLYFWSTTTATAITSVGGLAGATALLSGPVGVVVLGAAALTAGGIYVYNSINDKNYKEKEIKSIEAVKDKIKLKIKNNRYNIQKAWENDIEAQRNNYKKYIDAINKNDVNIIKNLINQKFDFNTILDSDKNTGLIIAASKGYTYLCCLLLENNASVNEVDINDKTALIHATINNHPEVVNLLLKNNADKNLKDDDKKIALDYAENELIKNILNSDYKDKSKVKIHAMHEKSGKTICEEKFNEIFKKYLDIKDIKPDILSKKVSYEILKEVNDKCKEYIVSADDNCYKYYKCIEYINWYEKFKKTGISINVNFHVSEMFRVGNDSVIGTKIIIGADKKDYWYENPVSENYNVKYFLNDNFSTNTRIFYYANNWDRIKKVVSNFNLISQSVNDIFLPSLEKFSCFAKATDINQSKVSVSISFDPVKIPFPFL